MGKAARWLRNLLGGGGKKEQGRDREQRRPASTNNGAAAAAPNGDRKRWSFCKSSSRDTSEPEAAQAGANNGGAAIARAAEAAWLRSLYKETEREQSKHAIAVAAATAVAADAAVAAAQAAVEVVRLTSQGPLLAASPRAFAGAGEDGPAAAAVKIQTAFRGYLAKKALRALKALVKLQALVRGYLVRKQAAATLQSMQALVRAQASIRAAARSRAADLRLHHLHPLAVRPPRYSLQEDTRSEHSSVAPCYYYGRRMSASVESSSSYGYDRSPKIVEMDTARPKSRSSSLPVTEPGDDYAYYSVSSPLVPCGHGQNLPGLPPRIAAPSGGRGGFFLQDYEREKPRPATAQSTPRCASSLYYTPVTPAKSVCGVGGYSSNSPSTLHSNGPRSYMSSTQSSDAKARSQSAPKQRPDDEPAVVLPRKRVPLSEVVLEARASLSGGTQRHCYYSSSSCNNKDNNNRQMKAEEAFSFKKAVVSRFDRSSEPADRDRDLFLRKGW